MIFPVRPEISVIVPVLDGGADFGRCLDALAAAPVSPAWELIVVDDGSTDGSADCARAAGARLLFTAHPRSGPAVARNLGAVAARGEFLLFVDADVLVTPHTVHHMIQAFRAEPSLTAVFGSYDARPASPNFISQYKNLFHHFVHQASRSDATTFWSGCGAIRRSVFLDFGGFDTSYGRPSIEDIELGYRLTTAGCAVRLRHDIQVTHLKRWTAASLLLSDVRDRGIPWTRLMLRKRTFTSDLNLQASNRVSVACIALMWIALAAAVIEPLIAWAALPLAIVVLGLNAPLYRFFQRQRGVRFMVIAIPWHWLYYTYNGLCFVAGAIAHAFAAGRRRAGSSPRPAPVRLLHTPVPPGEGGALRAGRGDRATGRGYERRPVQRSSAGSEEAPARAPMAR